MADGWSLCCCGCHAGSVTVKDEPADSSTATVKSEIGRGSGRQAQPGTQPVGTDARTEMQMLQVSSEQLYAMVIPVCLFLFQ